MIRLVTGNPGNAKTLFTLYDLIKQIEEHKKDGLNRKVYYYNIEFNPEHELYEQVKDWIKVEAHDLTINLPSLYDNQHPTIEQGSIILADECQDLYPTRSKGEVPPFLKFFEKHRHTGCDFWLITQKPRQLDIHVRELTGEHYHFQRVLGRDASRVKFLNRLIDDKSENSPEIQTQVRKFPKQLFGLYKSAVLHTHKRKLPWKLTVGLPLIALFLAAMIFVVYHILFSKHKTESATVDSTTLNPPIYQTKPDSNFKIYLSTTIQLNGKLYPVFTYRTNDNAQIQLFYKDLAAIGKVTTLRPGVYKFNGSIIPNLPNGQSQNDNKNLFPSAN